MRIRLAFVLTVMLACSPALRAQEQAPAMPAAMARPVQTAEEAQVQRTNTPAQITVGSVVLLLPRGWTAAVVPNAQDGGAAPMAAFAAKPAGSDFTPNVNFQEDAVTLGLNSYLEQSRAKLEKLGVTLSAFDDLPRSVLPWKVAAAKAASQGKEFALRLYVVRRSQGFLVATCTRLSTQAVALEADCDALVQSARLLE
jgi:hypothetical protein